MRNDNLLIKRFETWDLSPLQGWIKRMMPFSK